MLLPEQSKRRLAHRIRRRLRHHLPRRGVHHRCHLLQDHLLDEVALRGEEEVQRLLRRHLQPLGLLSGGGGGGVALEALAQLLQPVHVQARQRSARVGIRSAVEHLPQGVLRARRVVREEPPRKVRVALRCDGVVFVLREANALEDGESAEDVGHPGRNLERVLVALHLLHLLRHVPDAHALASERALSIHALHLLANGLAQLLARKVAELIAHSLLNARLRLLGPAALGQLLQNQRQRLHDPGLHDDVLLPLGHEPEVDQVLRDLRVILGDQVRDVLEEAVLQVLLDLDAHPEVEDAQPPVGSAQEVAGVRVTVQQARIQQHRQVRVQRHSRQPPHIPCLGRGQTLAVDPLGDKDSVGAELVNHFRGRHRIQTPRLHGLKEALRVHSLPLIVQLVHEPRAPLVDEADKVGVELHEALVRRRDDAAEVEVQRDVQHHVRPLNLHGHLRAIRQHSLVDLPDARRGNWRRGQGLEDVRDRALAEGRELLGDDVLGDVCRKRLHSVLKLAQLRYVRRRQQVAADRQRLSDLDGGGAELGADLQDLLRAHRHVLLPVLAAVLVLVAQQPDAPPAKRLRQLHRPPILERPALREKLLSLDRVVLASLVRHLGVIPRDGREPDDRSRPQGKRLRVERVAVEEVLVGVSGDDMDGVGDRLQGRGSCFLCCFLGLQHLRREKRQDLVD
mmetsp:Transcript_33033/g.78774  ORF Transcript_33033/g.78774 Transcript_33033/m.78774 type:complete len:680 (-) Transcript_33033:684-2723(-)